MECRSSEVDFGDRAHLPIEQLSVLVYRAGEGANIWSGIQSPSDSLFEDIRLMGTGNSSQGLSGRKSVDSATIRCS